jgi:FSR family fosmidomycin resistance protein-like MFS transporter
VPRIDALQPWYDARPRHTALQHAARCTLEANVALISARVPKVDPGMSQTIPVNARTAAGTAAAVLGAISLSHLINDMLQSLLPAIYPLLKARYGLSFGQIGAVTLVNNLTASVLQPMVGHVTDRRPYPYSLPVGMALTLVGLLMLAAAGSYALLLVAVALVGVGSSIFHPESSRVARLASGGQHGMAQSVFQVGGNAGSALGPLLAASVVAPGGQASVAWCALAAVPGIMLLTYVGGWYGAHRRAPAAIGPATHAALPGRRIAVALAVLTALMLSKFVYMASLGNYYTFYLIDRFQLTVRDAQYCLFAFLASVAVGTIIGGPIGDRIGRKKVIWVSILGVLPLTLALPYLGLWATVAVTVPIGLLLASAFPAIVVYAQELMPGRVGTVSGLMFGLAFGLGGLGAAGLGMLADGYGIQMVFRLCAFLPALGLLAWLLPDTRHAPPARAP